MGFLKIVNRRVVQVNGDEFVFYGIPNKIKINTEQKKPYSIVYLTRKLEN